MVICSGMMILFSMLNAAPFFDAGRNEKNLLPHLWLQN